MTVTHAQTNRRIFVTSWSICCWVARNQSNMANGKDAASITSKVSKQNPNYVNTLASEDLKSFREKLRIRVGEKIEFFRSPCEVCDNQKHWSDSLTSWPQISWKDLNINLIMKPGPFAPEKMRAVKNLEAYDYFVSRKVPQIRKGE